MNGIPIPNKEEFIREIEEFEKHEKRDAIYKVASFLIHHFWGNPSEMANALGVLLLIWNHASYRYGAFDFDKLELCIEKNLEKLETFRNRSIDTFSKEDEKEVKDLFNDFLEALKSPSGKCNHVAVAKALHLLAPEFFPLWDEKIAKGYGCSYNTNNSAEQYIKFMYKIKKVAENVRKYLTNDERRFIYLMEKSILKLIDEYNYSKYTKKWI